MLPFLWDSFFSLLNIVESSLASSTIYGVYSNNYLVVLEGLLQTKPRQPHVIKRSTELLDNKARARRITTYGEKQEKSRDTRNIPRICQEPTEDMTRHTLDMTRLYQGYNQDISGICSEGLYKDAHSCT